MKRRERSRSIDFTMCPRWSSARRSLIPVSSASSRAGRNVSVGDRPFVAARLRSDRANGVRKSFLRMYLVGKSGDLTRRNLRREIHHPIFFWNAVAAIIVHEKKLMPVVGRLLGKLKAPPPAGDGPHGSNRTGAVAYAMSPPCHTKPA